MAVTTSRARSNCALCDLDFPSAVFYRVNHISVIMSLSWFRHCELKCFWNRWQVSVTSVQVLFRNKQKKIWWKKEENLVFVSNSVAHIHEYMYRYLSIYIYLYIRKTVDYHGDVHMSIFHRCCRISRSCSKHISCVSWITPERGIIQTELM